MPIRFTAEGPTADAATPREGARLSLAVLADGFVGSHPLPETGTITLGRGADADIRVEHESVSRRHASIHLDGGLFVEDLGSSNGTKLGDQQLDPGKRVAFEAGEVIEIGSVMLVVQRQATAPRPRRVWSHDAFEARVETACREANPSTTVFAVMRVRATGLAAAAIQDGVLEHVRASDIVARYGPTDIEILALDTPREVADGMLKAIRGTLAGVGGKVTAALAAYPRDGTQPEVLIGRAGDGLRGQRSAASFVCESAAMQDLDRMVQRVAAGMINVLLHGETGAGKEVIADRLHELSPRAGKPMLKLNCAAFSDTLLESELFGHERGAFTGATETKRGLLETASGGTVFLDEIGDLPLGLQAKLLRVIEERRVMRVGGLEPRAIDVRFIAATHRDLEAAVAAQTFRQDLFYRLNGITLMIPPLRERREEIQPLAEGFAASSARALGLATTPQLTPQAIDMLERYAWPGNVRELRNVMERAVLLADGEPIAPEHLPLEKLRWSGSETGGGVAPLRTGIAERERAMIVDALERTNGNQTEAAKLLGISRRTLVSRLSEHNLPRPRKK